MSRAGKSMFHIIRAKALYQFAMRQTDDHFNKALRDCWDDDGWVDELNRLQKLEAEYAAQLKLEIENGH